MKSIGSLEFLFENPTLGDRRQDHLYLSPTDCRSCLRRNRRGRRKSKTRMWRSTPPTRNSAASTVNHFILLFTSDKGGGLCDCPRCLSVCLSVSKIIQKCVNGFGWNFAWRQVSGYGQTDQLLSPIRIIVRMPKRKIVEVGQTGTLLKAGYRLRDALQRDTVYSTL